MGHDLMGPFSDLSENLSDQPGNHGMIKCPPRGINFMMVMPIHRYAPYMRMILQNGQ